MKAVVLHQFDGSELLQFRQIPIPEIAPSEVLVQLDYSAVSTWDIFEREGGYAEMIGHALPFPYVLGSEGAGTVAAIGSEVKELKIGDSVYVTCFLNPKGGTYAEYVAVESRFVSHLPKTLNKQQASVISGIGITALRGLKDILQLKKGESILIFGASGGVGHIAVQLAKAMGARVCAVASGEDGADLVKKLGADVTLNGRKEDALKAVQDFAPKGFDKALLTAGGKAAENLIPFVRKGGRIAFPNGVQLDYEAPIDIEFTGYNGEPDADIIKELNDAIDAHSITVHVSEWYSLTEARKAHEALEKHYLGKIGLQIRE